MADGSPFRLVLAVMLPLALLGLVYAVFAISNALVIIGPVDRATFGWLVVIPSWAAIPGLAGLVWAPLPLRERWTAALAVAGVVAVVATMLLATSITQVGCRAVMSWTDDLPLSIAVGMLFGAAHGAAGLAAAGVASHVAGAVWRPTSAILAGAAVLIAGSILSGIALATLLPIGVSCPAPFPA